jgi:hemerythrin-like domain-containing protein
MTTHRRQFLQTAAVGVAGLMPALALARDEDRKGKPPAEHPEEEVSAPEDLMREHGVLNRILLVYEEGLRRLRAKEDVPPEAFHRPAELVRRFVEDYHEQLEEKFIFPEFEKRKQMVDLVTVLRKQHAAGRALTETVLRLSAAEQFRRAESRQELADACQAFIRMYRPHEAREDTVLFPALRKIVPAKELGELGEKFEKEEDRLFGEGGFEKTVEQVAAIEKQLGIHDLDQFTPKVPGK